VSLSKEEKIRLAELNAPNDKDINLEDIPELTEEQLAGFKRKYKDESSKE